MAFQSPDWTDDSAATTRASSVAPENGINPLLKKSDNAALRKSVLERKHGELDESKESDALKRLRYLLSLTDVFRHFIDSTKNPQVKALLAQIDKENEEERKKAAKGHARTGGAAGGRHRRTEQEEDAELLRDERRGGDNEYVFQESPGYILNGTMRDYQIDGLNWLVSLHNKGLSGILADEMGLGKTLQTVAFLGYLRYIADIPGPHLVTVPKSTLDNWRREFNNWTPGVNVCVLQGTKEERADKIAQDIATENFDVLITSYEMILREKSALKKLPWQYIIVDEAHRIKNENSSLAQIIREFHSRGRLLITGTPLQNNLHELWALLNFLLPDVFEDPEVFDQWFSGQNEDQDTVIQQLHRVLRPFLLRRVKNDVEKSLAPKKEVNLYIGMSDMQLKWYKKILEKDIAALNGHVTKKESKTRLLNIVMQLRKCCNHPYLFDGAEPGPPYTTDEHLITNAGKMVMLDKLLTRFKNQGSRVLIFSQMSRVLDILEDYSVFRDHKYCRIDGSTQHEDRIKAIDDYNAPGSEKFLFLLTTRAGGLGINLTTADIVILFDSDWNPQADLQAMDRAHRIGQTKQVYVYRFVTESAIEEKVLERAAQKLRLDQLVIQQGRAQQAAKAAQSKEELIVMIRHGAEDLIHGKEKTDGPSIKQGLTDDDIEAILRQGEAKTAELNAKFEHAKLDELQNFTSENAYKWNGQDFTGIGKDRQMNWIEPAKRERKEQSYSQDLYYRQALHPNAKPAEQKPKVPRPPKQITIHDWQFFPQELAELQDRESAYFRKEIGFKVPLPENAELDDDEREALRATEQAVIDNAEPLTEAEFGEKARLSEMGFSDWSKREFQQFISGCAKHGRSNWFSIAQEIEGKTEKEVKTYGTTFFKRIKELPDHARYLSTIEAGEAKAKKVEQQRKMLRKKMEMYRVPLQQLKLNYSVSTTNKKVYTEEEDRFILVMLDRHGLDNENIHEIIRDEIRESPLFRFDWFVLSRTPQEIARRCTTLLTTVEKEFEQEKENKAPVSNGVKGRPREEVEEDAEEEDDTPPKKKAKTAVKNKVVETVKQEAKKPKSNGRSSSVGSNGIKTPTGKNKKK